MSSDGCNSVRSVGLVGRATGMLAYQDALPTKDTLARRGLQAAEGFIYVFF